MLLIADRLYAKIKSILGEFAKNAQSEVLT